MPYGAWVGEWRGGEAGAEEEPELNAGRAGAREGLTCQEIEGGGGGVSRGFEGRLDKRRKRKAI